MQNPVFTPLLHKQLTNELDETDKQILLDWLASSKENIRLKEEIEELWELSGNYTPKFKPDVDKAFDRFSHKIKGEVPDSSLGERKSDRFNPFKNIKLFFIPLLFGILALMAWNWSVFIPTKSFLVSTLDNNIKEISLSDGTIVWLNQKSSLSYDNKFNLHDRKVALDGEAYFIVAPSKTHSFIIETKDAIIVAEGTAFSFNSQKVNGDMEVDVKEGTVKLIPNGSDQQLVLSANELGVYNPKNKVIKPKKILQKSRADYFIHQNDELANAKAFYTFNLLGKIFETTFVFDSKSMANCEMSKYVAIDPGNLEESLLAIELAYGGTLSFITGNDNEIIITGSICD